MAGLQRVDSAQRLGWADAVNLGLHQAHGAVLVLVDTSLEPTGDFLDPLLAAFDDPRVGLAGPWGVVSGDGRQFQEASEDADRLAQVAAAINERLLQSQP